MGTSVSSRSPYLITVTGTQGGGLGTSLGGMADVYAPPMGGMGTGLLGGGMMGFDQDSGIPSDTVDPSKAPKADMTQSEYDELIDETDAIRNGTLSDEAKRAAISEKLTEAGVAHDPNTLDLKSNSDQSGLINKRINITDAAGGEAAPSSPSISQSTVQDIQDVFGGDSSAAAVTQATIADMESMAGDADLEGSVDTIASNIEGTDYPQVDPPSWYTKPESAAIEGLQVGDVITDSRISGDYSFVYDAEQNVFHYTPFDAAGNRIYTGETIDASTVTGWSGTTTGETASILFDNGKPYIESSAKTTDGSTDGTIDITVNTTGAVGADAANIITGATGGTATLNNTGSLGTATTSTTTGTATTGTGGGAVTLGDGAGPAIGPTQNGGGGGNVTVINGTDGKDGRDGVDGTDGRDGVDGRDGADGADGAKGDKGDKGDKGERGASGVIALTAPIANKLFGDQFVFEDVIKPEFLGLLNLRGRR